MPRPASIPDGQPAKRHSLFLAFAFSAVALAAYGATRLLFNILGLRLFSPELVGRVNTALAGAATVAVLCAAPIGTALTTAVAQRGAAADHAQTRRTLATFWIAGITVITVAAVVFLLISGAGSSLTASIYLLCFGGYLLTRAALLGEHRHDLLARFEVFGFAASMTGLTIACLTRSEPIAMLVLLIHPVVVSFASLFRYGSLITSFCWQQSTLELRAHRGLVGATFLLSLSGIASYHLVLLILSARGRPDAEIGFIATLLSALNALSLAPMALGMILLPEQARQQGLGNVGRQQELIRRPTVALQALFAALFLLAVGGAGLILPTLGVSASGEHLLFWSAACVSVFVSIVSAPSGNFLNGASAARVQAVICIISFSLGTATSWTISAVSGAGGAAAMLLCSGGLASLARIVVADRMVGALAGRRFAFWFRTTATVVALFSLSFIPSIAVRVALSLAVIALYWAEWCLIAREITVRFRRRLAVARSEVN